MGGKASHIRLFVHCKDTNLKAIHNSIVILLGCQELFVHCKDTNLKAIHNELYKKKNADYVVRALQRY